MATVIERTAPVFGKRAVLIGMAGLLLGGIAGGLVGARLQSNEPVLGLQSAETATAESAPAGTGPLTSAGPNTDIEALRAQQYAPAPVVDIEALRAQRFTPAKVEAAAPAPVDIEALRAQRYGAPAAAPAALMDIEAVRAQRYAPLPVVDIEALRAQRFD